jgi:hypothetical protein
MEDVAWLSKQLPYGDLDLKQEAGRITRVITTRNWTKQDIDRERQLAATR